jgi:hypothetical protein
MARLPPNTVMSPHLFKKVAVPDICVDWLKAFFMTSLFEHTSYIQLF